MADTFEKKLAEDFFQFAKGDYDDIQVKVFLCGEALDPLRTIEDQQHSNLRAYLKVKMEEQVKGCTVTLAEHKKLIDAYTEATAEPEGYANLTDYELVLARWENIIIILPSSAGSIAELGMFAVLPKFTPKLLIFFDQSHGFLSYLWNGPVKAAAPRGSKVVVTDYKNVEQILETVVRRVRYAKSIKRSNKLLAE